MNAKPPPIRDELEKPKILIVDHQATRLFSVEKILNKMDVTLFEASSGEDALELSQKHEFAAVLAHANMPAMNGIQLVEKLHRQVETRDLPALLFVDNLDQINLESLGAMDGNLDLLFWPASEKMIVCKVMVFLNLFRYRRALDKEVLKRKRIEEKLKQSAQLDQLTFIANRRYFKQQFAVEWRRLLRDFKAFSLIMTDIDFFESYKDALGYQSGDLCLIKVGNAIRSAFSRAADFVARIEDAGFVVVLPDTDVKGAKKIAERIKKAVEDLAIQHPNSSVSDFVTISQGVGTIITSPHIEPNELIALADQALFQAKKKGGNEIFIAEFNKTGA